jgi:hypothetical protein
LIEVFIEIPLERPVDVLEHVRWNWFFKEPQDFALTLFHKQAIVVF